MKRVILVLLAGTGLLLGGCGEDEGAPAGSGLIEATEVIVSAETGGRVTAIRFDEGSRVMTGDTLLAMDTTTVALQLASARAGRSVAVTRSRAARLEVERAEESERYAATELNRVRRLVESSTASQRQLDQAEHQHTTARIAVEAARAQVASIEAEIEKVDADIAVLRQKLDDAVPQAPVSGTITDRYTDIGELLAPGRPIAKIARLDTVWVRVYLPMRDFARVSLGQKATIDTEAGSTLEGIVTWTSDEAEFTPKNVQTKKSRADLVYAVEIRAANPEGRLKVGQPVYVTIGK